MEATEEIRKKIACLITERGLNFAKVSLSIGKNIAYIQQFIKNGSPRRLGEVERQKLARLLNVDEQELTDLPLKNSSASAQDVNQDILCLIIENIETWLEQRKLTLPPHNKAELIRLIYSKIYNEPEETANKKIKDFIDIYDEVRKAN
ncbi:MAG: hypothetical protein Q4D80_02545 [Pseudomonadota bacterium]|nr:hypothetical protein [Pseudomonadota bacterium]